MSLTSKKDELWTGDSTGHVTLWDLKRMKKLKSTRAHCTGSVSDIRAVQNIQNSTQRICICTCSMNDSKIKCWDVKDQIECVKVLAGHNLGVNCIETLAPGKLLSGSDDTYLRVWDLVSGESLIVLKTDQDIFRCISLNARVVCVSSQFGCEIRFYDLEKREAIKCLANVHRGAILALESCSDGHQLLSSSEDGEIKLWNTF
jgi:WD40 repeat protein